MDASGSMYNPDRCRSPFLRDPGDAADWHFRSQGYHLDHMMHSRMFMEKMEPSHEFHFEKRQQACGCYSCNIPRQEYRPLKVFGGMGGPGEPPVDVGPWGAAFQEQWCQQSKEFVAKSCSEPKMFMGGRFSPQSSGLASSSIDRLRSCRYQTPENQVVLHKWFLVRLQDASVAVAGFGRYGMDSDYVKVGPIVERLDKFRLRTRDGVDVRLMGCIDEEATVANGFSVWVAQLFLTGFPCTWRKVLDDDSVVAKANQKANNLANEQCDTVNLSTPVCKDSKTSAGLQATESPVSLENAFDHACPETPAASIPGVHPVSSPIGNEGEDKIGDCANDHLESKEEVVKEAVSVGGEPVPDSQQFQCAAPGQIDANGPEAGVPSQDEPSSEPAVETGTEQPTPAAGTQETGADMLEPSGANQQVDRDRDATVHEVSAHQSARSSVTNRKRGRPKAGAYGRRRKSARRKNTDSPVHKSAVLETSIVDEQQKIEESVEHIEQTVRVEVANPVEEQREHTRDVTPAEETIEHNRGATPAEESTEPIIRDVQVIPEATSAQEPPEDCRQTEQVNSPQPEDNNVIRPAVDTSSSRRRGATKRKSASKKPRKKAASAGRHAEEKREGQQSVPVMELDSGDEYPEPEAEQQSRRPTQRPKRSALPPPLPASRVAKSDVIEAYGLKTSRSGRLLVPPLAYWRNQTLAHDKDGGIIAILDGFQEPPSDTGYFNFKPPSEKKRLQQKLCATAWESPAAAKGTDKGKKKVRGSK